MPRIMTVSCAAALLFAVGCSRKPATEPDEPRASVSPTATVAPGQAPAKTVAVAPMPREVALRITGDAGAPVAVALPVAPFPHEPRERDLTNEDPGLDTKIEAALPELDRLDKVTVENVAKPPENIGAPPGVDAVVALPGVPGAFREDPPAKGPALAPFAGRKGAIKEKLLKEGGGNAESERAVALGLSWLAKQQRVDGSWVFDQGTKEEVGAATGFALLAFLGAGETHKDVKGKYQKTVRDGVSWMTKATTLNGANAGRISTNAYTQGIATLALVEAYGMTKDAALKPTAQAAINFIQKAQAPNGSWGYSPGNNGDTSITGWQLQALTAAKQAGLAVDEKVLAKAVKFLDLAGSGAKKAMYGYADNTGAAPGTALTAIGLLSRAYIDNWSAETPGMIDGVAGLVKNGPRGKGGITNLYYYYYATQVVRNAGGDDWLNWNEGPKGADGERKGGMRDWLVGQQIKKDGANLGSWDPETGWYGTSCGRVGTTAVCVLQLEVYYRCLPLEKKKDDPKK